MISIGDAASGIEPTLAVSAKPNQSAGNVYRQSSTSVAVPIGGTANRRTYKWLSNAEDTVSEVEDYLIQVSRRLAASLRLGGAGSHPP